MPQLEGNASSDAAGGEGARRSGGGARSRPGDSPAGSGCELRELVRWVREYNEVAPDTSPGMGIMFEGLSTEQENDINAYLARSNPLFYEM